MAIKKLKESNKKNGRCRLGFDADMSIYGAARNHEDLMLYFHDFDHFEIDMSAVEEVDCSGIQLLLALKLSAEAHAKTMTITAVSEPVSEVMDVLNIKDQFDWSDQPGH